MAVSYRIKGTADPGDVVELDIYYDDDGTVNVDAVRNGVTVNLICFDVDGNMYVTGAELLAKINLKIIGCKCVQ